MNTKKILGVVAVLALVAVAMVGAVSATADGNITVTDSSATPIQIGTTYTSLSDAITAVNTDATAGITLPYVVTITSANTEKEGYIEILKSVTVKSSDSTQKVIDFNGFLVGDYDRDAGTSSKAQANLKVKFENLKLKGTYNIIQVCEPNTELTLYNVNITEVNSTTTDKIMCAITLAPALYDGSVDNDHITRNAATDSKVYITNSELKSTADYDDVADHHQWANDNGVIGVWASGCTVSVVNSKLTATNIPIVTVANTGAGYLKDTSDNSIIKPTGNAATVMFDSACTLTTATSLLSAYDNAKYQYMSGSDYTTYAVDTTIVDDTSKVSLSEQDKNTTVKLDFESTYTFTIPTEVSLVGKEDGYKIGVVEVKSSVMVPGKKAYVTLDAAKWGTTEAANGTENLMIQLSGGSDTVTYNLRDSSATGSNIAVKGNIITLDLVSSASPNASKNVYFYTTSMSDAKNAGTYTGTLTFKMEVKECVTVDVVNNTSGTISPMSFEVPVGTTLMWGYVAPGSLAAVYVKGDTSDIKTQFTMGAELTNVTYEKEGGSAQTFTENTGEFVVGTTGNKITFA